MRTTNPSESFAYLKISIRWLKFLIGVDECAYLFWNLQMCWTSNFQKGKKCIGTNSNWNTMKESHSNDGIIFCKNVKDKMQSHFDFIAARQNDI